MTRPLLLDLFCGAGGAAAGYRCAGFDVFGVDIASQPHYLDSGALMFTEAEWSDGLDFWLENADVAAIHASPPCQGYSRMRHLPWLAGKEYPLLIDATRERLQATGLPWVIENVEDAPMPYSTVLCGQDFGLTMYRHRRFGSSILIMSPPHRRHERVITPGRMIKDRGRVSSWETGDPAAGGDGVPVDDAEGSEPGDPTRLYRMDRPSTDRTPVRKGRMMTTGRVSPDA